VGLCLWGILNLAAFCFTAVSLCLCCYKEVISCPMNWRVWYEEWTMEGCGDRKKNLCVSGGRHYLPFRRQARGRATPALRDLPGK